MSNKQPLKIYKLICDTFGHRFSFNAKDMEDAINKKKDWCNYHSFNHLNYKVEETTDTKYLHNEYVN